MKKRGIGGGYDVAVLVSGGVDSAVALHLLIERGFAPLAVTLRLAGFAGAADSAAELADRLDVDHVVVDLRREFLGRVVDPFVAAYLGGLTPNPCVYCNPDVKFGLARAWVLENAGTDAIATGHYAAIVERAEAARLGRPRCLDRDQSYFLYRLVPGDLAKTRFPLADVRDKGEVRAIAGRLGLRAAGAGDSMDICFLPGGDYRELVSPEPRPGPILDLSGREVGRHDGHANFTVGQRKGLKTGFGRPMYVVRVDPASNTVVIGDRSAVARRRVAARNVVLHAPDGAAPGARVFAKIRSGGAARPAVVAVAGEERLAVDFDEPVFGPAAGQHLVLYDGEGLVIGGGEIEKEEFPCPAS